jgi:hypothetical protein
VHSVDGAPQVFTVFVEVIVSGVTLSLSSEVRGHRLLISNNDIMVSQEFLDVLNEYRSRLFGPDIIALCVTEVE